MNGPLAKVLSFELVLALVFQFYAQVKNSFGPETPRTVWLKKIPSFETIKFSNFSDFNWLFI